MPLRQAGYPPKRNFLTYQWIIPHSGGEKDYINFC